jgi:hypothetical protein
MEWIAMKAYDNKAVNRTELLHYWITKFGPTITRGWVDSFLSRDASELLKTKVPLKKIKDLNCHESSLKLQLNVYKSTYILPVQSLF